MGGMSKKKHDNIRSGFTDLEGAVEVFRVELRLGRVVTCNPDHSRVGQSLSKAQISH